MRAAKIQTQMYCPGCWQKFDSAGKSEQLALLGVWVFWHRSSAIWMMLCHRKFAQVSQANSGLTMGHGSMEAQLAFTTGKDRQDDLSLQFVSVYSNIEDPDGVQDTGYSVYCGMFEGGPSPVSVGGQPRQKE